jgi:uncharacterized protein
MLASRNSLEANIMLESISLDGPVDLAALDDFLASDRTPPDCMQLSELDGFMAGVVVGPEMVPPSKWLPMVWHDGEPDFADIEEAKTILGIIMLRYNEIIRLVDSPPGSYRPVLVEQDDGNLDASDWALGFLQAMALCQDGWEPMVRDSMAGALIAPIMLIASTTDKANLPLDDDERLPDAEMVKLQADAGPILSLCVSGMRAFFQERLRRPPKRKRAGRPKRRAR